MTTVVNVVYIKVLRALGDTINQLNDVDGLDC